MLVKKCTGILDKFEWALQVFGDQGIDMGAANELLFLEIGFFSQ
jgi:hypothetical protein